MSSCYQSALVPQIMLDSVNYPVRYDNVPFRYRRPLSKVNESTIAELHAICEDHVGEHKLKFVVVDDQNNHLSIDLMSSNSFVNANYEFAQSIEELGIKYQLNR